jgi:preprotein translocase subunit YajC
MKFTKLAVTAAITLAALPGMAMAQLKGPEVNATVFGPQGGQVGTITKIEGGAATVNTGTVEAALPLNIFGNGVNGPVISVTKSQLEQMVQQAQAQQSQQVQAMLVGGTPVVDASGMALGTVKSVGDAGVVVTSEFGDFTLQRSDFAMVGEQLGAKVRVADVQAQLAAE